MEEGEGVMQRQAVQENAKLPRQTMRYKADLTAGSLKIPESRIIADLLLRGVAHQQWRDVLIKQNILQVRNPATAIRLALMTVVSLLVAYNRT
jgi:hypothetical protein